ncbi:L,D-transpeptidase family protein [Martelella mediterranea]|uniref:L,D-transpeptidase family protein n=1 Tax=Martelella mediterranea TaxID=293089 RepID=UPI001E5ED2E1|nr:murein L,D-transpeptidase family protein [Martelella mediterranea]
MLPMIRKKRRATRGFRFSVIGILMAGLVLTGCVTSTLELDGRGDVPIPQKTVAKMRDMGMRPADPVLVRIFKQESELEVWKRDSTGKYALMKTYPMCRWSGVLGPKKFEGDRQAPEGFYTVNSGRLNPRSQYYLSFDLGYPNRLERAKGYTGSALMVHGACSSSGCFAISDEYVAEVYAVVREALKGGQQDFQVQSYPFRMTPENLAAHNDNPNFDFWMDLKAGYDRFEVLRQPPRFQFCEGRYRFGEPLNGNSPTDPLGQCPAFEPEVQQVAEKSTGDIEKMKSLLNDVQSPGLAYSDGGMNPVFRKILAKKGPQYLSEITSSTAVPVSRPQAALADPFVARRQPLKAGATREQ